MNFRNEGVGEDSTRRRRSTHRVMPHALVAITWATGATVGQGQWPPVITDPEVLKTNADYDSGTEYNPQLATDRAGSVVRYLSSLTFRGEG